jgi:hypothetical protein
MKLTALFESSLDLMLRRWVLRCQQALIEHGDIATRISPVTAGRNPAFVKQLTLIDKATVDAVMSTALYNSVTYAIRADSVYIMSPFKQFLQAPDDTILDDAFTKTMGEVIDRFNKQ